MTLTGLVVTATLGSPVESDYALHLDGLLQEAAFRRLPHSRDVTRTTPSAEIPDLPIPLGRIRARGEHLWCASAWRFSGDAERAALHVVRRKDAEDLDRLVVGWTPNSGPGRNLLQRQIGTVARSVSWLAWGNRREVRKALRLMSSVGDRRRHGNGRVLEWTVEEDPTITPASCVVSLDGVALRHLPIDWCARVEGHVAHGSHRGPYWHPGRHGPVVLPGTVVELHADVAEACARPDQW